MIVSVGGRLTVKAARLRIAIDGRRRARPANDSGEEQMSYVESNLVPGETVIVPDPAPLDRDAGAHCRGMFAARSARSASAILRTQPDRSESGTLHIMEGGGVALLVCGVVAILMGMVRRHATEIAVTNRRVVIKTGLVSRRTIEMLLNKVESIEVSEPAYGRMLGYGTIVVIGTGGTPEPFQKVAHPLEFRSQVQQQIEKLH